MKTLKFATNIKNTDNIESLKNQFKGISGVIDWNVDLEKPEKVLTIKVENISSETIAKQLFAAGIRSQEIISPWKKAAKRLFLRDCCS